jgi:aminopeptidase N
MFTDLQKTPGILKKLHIMLIFFIVLSFTSCQRSLRSFYQEGVSHELAAYRGKQVYDVHYDLYFHVPENKNEVVTGTAKIYFKPLKARHGLIIDFQPGEDYIHAIKINGTDADYNFMNGHIYLDANGFVPRQENIVEIDFTSSDQALNRSDGFMYTLFVPDRASTAFPCFDQPDIKATFDLTLDIPTNWTAISNGPLTSDDPGESVKRLSFSLADPISTYVFSFAAGEFSQDSRVKDGFTINILHRETDKEKIERNISDIFDQHFHALKWMKEYTGIDYPYEKFDMVILPGFQYSGMEHPGAIWYRDTRLLLDENPPITRQISKASLIAHETAHMWFGNLVTMKWFDDVWLKEVFAGFMADKMVEEMFPEVNHQLQFMISHYPKAYSIDRTRGTHPIKQELENMKMAGTLYGPIIYNKAPIIFLQLEEIMQPAGFRAAVREYLSAFSHGNADWDDLVTIFDKHSDKNISNWSNAWVYGKGMPLVTHSIERKNDGFILTVDQQSPESENLSYSQLLSGYLMVNDQLYPTSFFMEAGKSDAQQFENKTKPLLAQLNARGMGYGFFEMENEEIAFAVENIHRIENEDIRSALYLNMHENFLNGKTDMNLYFDFLLDALWYERNQQLQGYLLPNLESVCLNFLDYENEPLYSGKVNYILWNSMLNDEITAKELFFESWIRLARGMENTEKLIRIYDGDMAIDGLTISDQNRTQLALEIAMRLPGDLRFPFSELDRIQNPDRKRRFEFIMPAVSHEKSVRDAFFEELKIAENRNPEPWVLDALYFLHHPLHEGQGSDYIRESLQMIEEIQKTGDIFFPQNWLNATLKNYRGKDVSEIVETFLSNNPELPQNLRLKVLQSADIAFRSAEMQ